MPPIDKPSSREAPPLPALWAEPAPTHFDTAIPLWAKLLLMAALILAGILWIDQPLALWARQHPIPDLGYHAAPGDPVPKGGDIARELMWLEQFGQTVCSVMVILAVALIDKAGPRRALAISIGCLATLAVTYLLKDSIGRARPRLGDMWGGPALGFTKGADWGAFPSAHTSAAFALAAGLSWFYPRARALFMTLATITASQRILHTAHFFSDALAGMTLGITITRATLQTKLAGKLIAASPHSARQWWLKDQQNP